MNASAAASALTFTGERFTPEVRGAIGYEHWHRYCAVASVVAGMDVLDAACGEGYGSYLLSRGAKSVIGVDIGSDAIEHAGQRYIASNLRFERGSVTALPLDDASVDVVVSFETIEHLAEQTAMLREFRRVLRLQGALIISSPNRPVYNEAGEVENEFHVKELDRNELAALIAPLFPQQRWHAQRVLSTSVLWQEDAGDGTIAFDLLQDDAPVRASQPAPPMYFVVVCGAKQASLPTLPALSMFDDAQLSLWKDYARAATRERELAWDELEARNIAEERLAELVTAMNGWASERERSAALQQQKAAYEAEAARLGAELEAEQAQHADARRKFDASIVQVREMLAREREAHADTRARLAFRESPAGWVRWPLSLARRRLLRT